MNSLIFKSLEKLDRSNIQHILPHQFASIDYIYRQIIDNKKNILIYHQMGTGKTIVSLITAFFLSKRGKNIYFILPSKQVKELWINTIDVIRKFIPRDNYDISRFFFETKKNFIKSVEKENKDVIGRKFIDSVFIIDEVHKLLGNTGSECLIKLQHIYVDKPDRPLFILVSGSPITNTILTFKDLYSLLTYKNINLTDYSVQNGSHIYNYTLTENGKKIIKEDMNGLITHFFFNKNKIPPVIYVGEPIINTRITKCKMSKIQNDCYEKIRMVIKNEMFLKYLLDASFTAMNDIELIKNFEEFSKSNKEYKVSDDLYINNGKFRGNELLELNNSCKIKYFVEEKINKKNNRLKTFVYFSNVSIGGRFLKDVMRAQGVKEYGTVDLPNFVCFVCGRDRTCKKCNPMTYMMITSIHITKLSKIEDEGKMDNHINYLLERFNSSFNENGEEVYFLFGSEIISESFTLKEVRDMWFLTIPYSISEYDQITARCIRNFSYKDITKPVYIHTLVAVFHNDDSASYIEEDDKIIKKINEGDERNKISQYVEQLENDAKYSFDVKKVLYLEIKSQHTNYIHEQFAKASLNLNEPPHADLIKMYIMEIFKYKIYQTPIVTIDEIIKELSVIKINTDQLTEILNEFIEDGIMVKTKRFKNSFIVKHENTFYSIPVILNNRKTLYNIPL